MGFGDVARTQRGFLPKDAAPGDEAAFVFFLRDDRKIAFAWWFFCHWCAGDRPAFGRQLGELAARAGRPVTPVDGIRVALRFWELSMAADVAFADEWRSRRQNVSQPKGEWGDLGPLIDELAAEEWERERDRVWTAEERKAGDLWGEGFKRKFGQSFADFVREKGLTRDEAGTIMIRASIEHDAVGIGCALTMWATAQTTSQIMILADRALSRPAAP
jgi:hypothetical protein